MQQTGKDVYKLSEGFYIATNKVRQTQHFTEDYLLACGKTTLFETAIFLDTACNHCTLMSGVMFHTNPY